MHILYELLPGALLHFAAWQYSHRRHIESSLHPLVLSDCAPTTLQKTKRMQASPQPCWIRIAATGAHDMKKIEK